MPSVLVDSNILIDLLNEDSHWYSWSARAVAEIGSVSRLVINQIIYAEASVALDSIEEMDEGLPSGLFERESIPYEAAFLAGKAYVSYRRRKGVRRSPLPDFFIGAHAAVAGHALLTRDPSRYRAYFPTVKLIAP